MMLYSALVKSPGPDATEHARALYKFQRDRNEWKKEVSIEMGQWSMMAVMAAETARDLAFLRSEATFEDIAWAFIRCKLRDD